MANLTREARLSAYLAAAARRRLEWGVFDCCVGLVSGWVDLEREVDCAAPFRGRYGSADEAHQLILGSGGLDMIFESRFRELGLESSDGQRLGDVGVIRWRDRAGVTLCGGIRTPKGWAALGARGLHVAPATPIRAWAV